MHSLPLPLPIARHSQFGWRRSGQTHELGLAKAAIFKSGPSREWGSVFGRDFTQRHVRGLMLCDIRQCGTLLE